MANSAQFAILNIFSGGFSLVRNIHDVRHAYCRAEAFQLKSKPCARLKTLEDNRRLSTV
jgi:hypothetical protein